MLIWMGIIGVITLLYLLVQLFFWCARRAKAFVFSAPHSPINLSGPVQEDPREQQMRQRVKAAFEAQSQQMNARALKPHSPSCVDFTSCKKIICATSQADRIVNTSVVARKNTQERLAEQRLQRIKHRTHMDQLKYGYRAPEEEQT